LNYIVRSFPGTLEPLSLCDRQGRKPEGSAPVAINKGCLEAFHTGMTRVWKIIEPMRKRYRIA